MCLPMAVDSPERILGRGEHLGFEWMVLGNHMGYRCGYVRVMPDHPWHGKGYNDVQDASGDCPDCHGGLTFAAADKACDKPGDDNGWWLGFDCGHWGDAPDPELPDYHESYFGGGGEVRTQAYVEAQCRHLCSQAARLVEVAHVDA